MIDKRSFIEHFSPEKTVEEFLQQTVVLLDQVEQHVEWDLLSVTIIREGHVDERMP